LKNFDKAMEYHIRSLAIREQGFGKLHPKTAESYACIGDLLVSCCKPMEAIPYYTDAMHAWDATAGRDNASSRRARDLLGQIARGEEVSSQLAEFF
jgi:hypothetical protein